MPGANYMGGKRNAAKARIKDTIGRLEKTFFGQRRLCAPSKGLLAPKPMQISSISLEGSLERADISLEHAKRRIPPKNDVITSSFVSRPEHINPSTPCSRRQTKRRVEAQPSSSNVSRSKVLDALDVSEPIFLRGVLDRILTIPDLAGISKNRTKPTGRQRQASDESSPLQRTKRKRSASDLYEGSDSPSDERSSSSSRHVQSHIYEDIYTPLRKKYTSSDRKIADNERARIFKNLLMEDEIFSYQENTSSCFQNDDRVELRGIDIDEIHDSGISEVISEVRGNVRSSPWSSRDYRPIQYSTSPKRPSSNYTLYSNLDSDTCLPTCILFQGFKDSSVKQPMAAATYPDEEPTVYGTLFEQADPWDTIGQILGLSNTRSSKSGEVKRVLSDIDQSEASVETHSGVVETIDVYSDDIQHPQLIEGGLIGLQKYRISPRCDSLEEFDRPEEAKTTISQSLRVREDAEEIIEEDQDCLSDIEALVPSSQDILVEFDVLDEQSSTEGIIGNEEYESVLAIPELQEADGFFMGPSLFELDEDEI